MAKLLQCPAFYRQVGGSDQKQALLNQLVQGQIRVIVATNALELGVDIGVLDAVMMFGFPRGGLPSFVSLLVIFIMFSSRILSFN